MVIVVGLLIMPEPYHRIVEDGSDSGRLHDVVTDAADLALFPFALAWASAFLSRPSGSSARQRA